MVQKDAARLPFSNRRALCVHESASGRIPDRHLARKPRVAGPPNLAHPAGPERRQDLVGSNQEPTDRDTSAGIIGRWFPTQTPPGVLRLPIRQACGQTPKQPRDGAQLTRVALATISHVISFPRRPDFRSRRSLGTRGGASRRRKQRRSGQAAIEAASASRSPVRLGRRSLGQERRGWGVESTHEAEESRNPETCVVMAFPRSRQASWAIGVTEV
jgi:hypothetical protein